MTSAGNATGSPPLSECYYSFTNLVPAELSYGVFDFLAFGFQHVRDHFAKSVLPLDITYVRDRQTIRDIGSSFQVIGGCLVTAAHCVQPTFEVKIQGWKPSANPLLEIHRSSNRDIDVAVLLFKQPLLPNGPEFDFVIGEILDDVLTMGYPPIPGFETVLTAETAIIAAQQLKTTAGQVIGTQPSYLGKQPLMLISARVKGGNSGGPVVGKVGKAVGIITDHAKSFDGSLDTMGYGIATPIQSLQGLLKECKTGTSVKLPFAISADGFEVR
jgi:serine protease Do